MTFGPPGRHRALVIYTVIRSTSGIAAMFHVHNIICKTCRRHNIAETLSRWIVRAVYVYGNVALLCMAGIV